MINVFIIDDHPMVIKGIKSIFKDENQGIRICGSALSAEESLSLIEESGADIILLDLMMPGISGVDHCSTLKKIHPDKKVIVLTGELNPVILKKAWSNMSDAIIAKYCGMDELVDVIKGVLQGRRIIGSDIPDFNQDNESDSLQAIKLTNRETLILKLLSEGNTREEVSVTISSSQDTVKFHCKNIFRKFGRNKLVSVIQDAKSKGLI